MCFWSAAAWIPVHCRKRQLEKVATPGANTWSHWRRPWPACWTVSHWCSRTGASRSVAVVEPLWCASWPTRADRRIAKLRTSTVGWQTWKSLRWNTLKLKMSLLTAGHMYDWCYMNTFFGDSKLSHIISDHSTPSNQEKWQRSSKIEAVPISPNLHLYSWGCCCCGLTLLWPSATCTADVCSDVLRS